MPSADTFMRQACQTADVYLSAAVRSIDAQLGSGYAKRHPELVAAYVNAAALDFFAGYVCQELGGKLSAVSEAIDRQGVVTD